MNTRCVHLKMPFGIFYFSTLPNYAILISGDEKDELLIL